MKKIIQILLIAILLGILSLIIIFVFNPFDLRTKIISNVVNSYLSSTIEGYTPLDSSKLVENISEESYNKHPLLSEEQEKMLENYGIDVSQLPSTISPEMEACFIDKLGQERTNQIIAGQSPTPMEVLKARSCLGE